MAFSYMPRFPVNKRTEFLSGGAHGNRSCQHLPAFDPSCLFLCLALRCVFSLEAHQRHGIRHFSTGAENQNILSMLHSGNFMGLGSQGKGGWLTILHQPFSRFCCISFHFSSQSALAGRIGTNTVTRRCQHL